MRVIYSAWGGVPQTPLTTKYCPSMYRRVPRADEPSSAGEASANHQHTGEDHHHHHDHGQGFVNPGGHYNYHGGFEWLTKGLFFGLVVLGMCQCLFWGFIIYRLLTVDIEGELAKLKRDDGTYEIPELRWT